MQCNFACRFLKLYQLLNPTPFLEVDVFPIVVQEPHLKRTHGLRLLLSARQQYNLGALPNKMEA